MKPTNRYIKKETIRQTNKQTEKQTGTKVKMKSVIYRINNRELQLDELEGENCLCQICVKNIFRAKLNC